MPLRLSDQAGSLLSWLAAAFAAVVGYVGPAIQNLSDPGVIAAWLAVVLAIVRILADLPKACRTVRAWAGRRNKGG